MELELITNPIDYPTIIHGTYLSYWNKIKTIGLSKMKRSHIYFTLSEPDDGKIEGLIRPSEIFIYIDLPKAIKGSNFKFKSSFFAVVTLFFRWVTVFRMYQW